MSPRTVRLIALTGAVALTGLTFAIAVGFMNGVSDLAGRLVAAHPAIAGWAGSAGVVVLLVPALVHRWRRRRAASARRPPPP